MTCRGWCLTLACAVSGTVLRGEGVPPSIAPQGARALKACAGRTRLTAHGGRDALPPYLPLSPYGEWSRQANRRSRQLRTAMRHVRQMQSETLPLSRCRHGPLPLSPNRNIDLRSGIAGPLGTAWNHAKGKQLRRRGSIVKKQRKTCEVRQTRRCRADLLGGCLARPLRHCRRPAANRRSDPGTHREGGDRRRGSAPDPGAAHDRSRAALCHQRCLRSHSSASASAWRQPAGVQRHPRHPLCHRHRWPDAAGLS